MIQKQIKHKRSNRSNVINLEKGKIPPQAVELEQAILGCAIQFKFAMSEIIEVISDVEDVFYKDEHKYIFKAMMKLFTDNEPIDLLTVSSQLKKMNKLELVGGDFYLIELQSKVSSSAHLEHHCRILMECYVKREAIKVSNNILERAYDESEDVFQLLEHSQRSLDDTSQWLLRKKPEDFKTGYQKFIENSEKSKPGVPSKFSKLAKKMSYQPGHLIIVAARPGMGKTALVLNEAKHQAKLKIPVGILSLEMTTNELIGRLVSEEFGIDSSRISEDQLTQSEKNVLKIEAHKIQNLPILIHDEGSLSTMSAKTIIGKWVRQFGVKVIYIDYLQLMEVYGKKTFGNREQEISYISRTLKSIAKEFEITIVALSQLSRAVEQRSGMKRPMLSDLRESGAIEQDADKVLFLFRPEYYKIEEWDDDERTPTEGQCEINVAKNRGGEIGAVIVSCNLKYMQFKDLEEPESWNNEPLPNQNPSQAFGIDEGQDDLPF